MKSKECYHMIIKQMDSLSARKLELGILKDKNLPLYKMERVTKELSNLLKGEKGEKNTAYYINFDLKESKNWAVIHDLRIEYKGEVAQIDHLLIGRMLDFYVLETKAFGQTLEMRDDETFRAIYGKDTYSIPSPIEQNNRHIRLLTKALEDNNVLPKRFGLSIKPKFKGFVLLSTETDFLRPKKADSNMVLKCDQFLSAMQKENDSIVNPAKAIMQLSKVISSETLKEVATKVAGLHTKGSFNYKDYFDISEDDIKEERKAHATTTSNNSLNFCAKCKTTISTTVAKFCFGRKQRFGGKAYCMSCQKSY